MFQPPSKKPTSFLMNKTTKLPEPDGQSHLVKSFSSGSPIKVTSTKKKPIGQSEVITKKKTVIPNPSGLGGRKVY